MFVRNSIFAMVFLFSTISFASTDTTKPIYEMNADGDVQIGADGQVSDYHLCSDLTPAVANLVERNVRAWRFEPILVDGAPVVAKTSVHIYLSATPVDEGNYKLRITSVIFGEPRRSPGMKPSRYPEEAVRAHVGGRVMLAIRLDEAGNVVEALPYQTSLDARARTESDAERYRKMLERVSVAAAMTWHFALSETIDGKRVGTSAMVPIAYYLSGPGIPYKKDDAWRAYLPGPTHPVPWLHDAPKADDARLASLQDGQALTLDSRFRLKDDVIGKTL